MTRDIFQKPKFIWLKEIDKYWVIIIFYITDILVTVVMTAGLILTLALFSGKSLFIMLLVLILVVVVFFIITQRIFFNTIKCPCCGHNPTRKKDNSTRKKNQRTIITQLSKLRSCPVCGAKS